MYLTGGTTGLTFRLGEAVEVELVEATPLRGGLLFSLLDGGSYDANAKRAIGKRRGPPRGGAGADRATVPDGDAVDEH